MWTRTYTKIYQGVKKEAVWRLWTDVNHWSKWHGDLDSCTLEGPFMVGNYFRLKPKGAPSFKIELTEVEEGRKFSDCTRFIGAKMVDTHELEEIEGGVRITNTLTVTGPLKYLWIKLVAQGVADSVPEETDNMIKLAALNE